MATSLQLAGALGHAMSDKRIEILRLIARSGSISQAARDAGVSYKAAWQAVDTLTNLAGVPLVERAVGGAGGGGAHLTAAGQELLQAARQVEAARSQALARLGAGSAATPVVATLALRTSMRNQLPCVLQGMQASGPIVRAQLVLANGASLRARITRESAELLGLAPGLPVVALCKATAVQVWRSPAGGGVAPGNCLPGKASRVTRGEQGDEVSAALVGGLQLVGFAPPGSRLRSGSAVELSVDEAAVVVALPG